MAASSDNKRGRRSGGFSNGFEDRSISFLQRLPLKENQSGWNNTGTKTFRDNFGRFRGGRGTYHGGRRSSYYGNCTVGQLCGSEYGKTEKIKTYMHEGVYIETKNKQVLLLTLNLISRDCVSNDKVVSTEDGKDKYEYRIWNPFTSKLAASIMRGITNIYIRRGSRVLYLGAESCITVSHVSDIVGHKGFVYVLETSLNSSTDLQIMAKLRCNIKLIRGDPTHPTGYRNKLQGMVDVVHCDLAQLEQASILALNARFFLKYKGNFMVYITVNGTDRSSIEAKIASELLVLIDEKLKPLESVNLEPYVKDRYIVNGVYLRKREPNIQGFCKRFLK